MATAPASAPGAGTPSLPTTTQATAATNSGIFSVTLTLDHGPPLTGLGSLTTRNGVESTVVSFSASNTPIASETRRSPVLPPPTPSTPTTSSSLLPPFSILSTSSSSSSLPSSLASTPSSVFSSSSSVDNLSSSATDSAGTATNPSSTPNPSPASGPSTTTLAVAIAIPIGAIIIVSILFWVWRFRRARQRTNRSIEAAVAREKGYQMTDVSPNSASSFEGSPPMKTAALIAPPPRPEHDAPPLHRHLRAPSKQSADTNGNPISAFTFPWNKSEREKRASRIPLAERDSDTLPPTLPVLGFGEAVATNTNSLYSDYPDTTPRTPAFDTNPQLGPHQSIANTDPGSRYSEGPGPSIVGSVSPPDNHGLSSRNTRDLTSSTYPHSSDLAREQAPSRNIYSTPFDDRSGSAMANDYPDDVSDIDENERRKSRKDTDAASVVSDLSEPGQSILQPESRTGTGLGSYSRQGFHSREGFR